MTDSDVYRHGDKLLHDWADRLTEVLSSHGYPRSAVEYAAVFGPSGTNPDEHLTRPERDANTYSEAKAVHSLLRQMPDEYQDAVYCRYVLKQRISEVARDAGISWRQAEARLTAAVLQVADAFRKSA